MAKMYLSRQARKVFLKYETERNRIPKIPAESREITPSLLSMLPRDTARTILESGGDVYVHTIYFLPDGKVSMQITIGNIDDLTGGN